MTQTLWKATRRRQDFPEELYLKITVSTPPTNRTFHNKITLDTTAGYFELPNYMNRGSPGPLIEDDPTNHCGLNCTAQGFMPDSIQ